MPASNWQPPFSLSQEAELEFQDRNKFEIQRMVDLILETATNGLKWARDRESERLDQDEVLNILLTSKVFSRISRWQFGHLVGSSKT